MKNRLFHLLLVLSIFVLVPFTNADDFTYRRAISGVEDEWQQVILPTDLFALVRNDLNDLRVLGITITDDTIEAPFIVRQLIDKRVSKQFQFHLINTSRKQNGYYYTFEVPESQIINEVDLDFENKNFDWRIKLEGSQNQNEWFEILDNFRILSIRNAETNYQFNRLVFPDSQYKYFRLAIRSDEKPELTRATIMKNEVLTGSRVVYQIKSMNTYDEHDQTIIDITLKQKVPVSDIELLVSNDYDFYRPVHFQYLVDSVETEKGWKRSYRSIAKGTISSLEQNEFTFETTILDNLRVIVKNHDNEPLDFSGCKVWSYQYVLVARFSESANYFMVYGNPHASKPTYDINHFTDQIPSLMKSVSLGDEEEIVATASKAQNIPILNKYWLWSILMLVIFVLLYFSLRMIKSK